MENIRWFTRENNIEDDVEVSISNTSLNLLVNALEVMGSPDYVLVGFDTNTKCVLLQPHNSSVDAYKIDKSKKQNQREGRIASVKLAKKILRLWGFTDYLKATKRCNCEWDGVEKILKIYKPF